MTFVSGNFVPRHELDVLRDQLAAKDREIAKLRKELSAEKCELRWAYGEAQETDVEKCAWKQRAQQAESERDEARECVGRLYRWANEHADCLQLEIDNAKLERKRKGYAEELASLRAALAATPEHLRK